MRTFLATFKYTTAMFAVVVMLKGYFYEVWRVNGTCSSNVRLEDLS